MEPPIKDTPNKAHNRKTPNKGQVSVTNYIFFNVPTKDNCNLSIKDEVTRKQRVPNVSVIQMHMFHCIPPPPPPPPPTNSYTRPTDVVQNLLKVVFSDAGSNMRVQEEATYMFFIQLLNESEGEILFDSSLIYCVLLHMHADPKETGDLTLEEILSFVTGADKVPPSGFQPSPSITFNQDNVYPKASTCALTLILPTKYHSDYVAFKNKLTFGFKNHGGFGLL